MAKKRKAAEDLGPEQVVPSQPEKLQKFLQVEEKDREDFAVPQLTDKEFKFVDLINRTHVIDIGRASSNS